MSSRLPQKISSANQAELIKDLIREGIAAAQDRKLRTACALFWNAIEIDPGNVQAWLWLSSTVERPIDQIACLETVLQIDPHNLQAHDQLARLTGVRRATPAIETGTVGQVIAQPSPPSQKVSAPAVVAEAVKQVVEQPSPLPSQEIASPVVAAETVDQVVEPSSLLFSQVVSTSAFAAEAVEQVVEPPSPPTSQDISAPAIEEEAVDLVVEPPLPPGTLTVSLSNVEGTQVEAIEEPPPLLESQPEQILDEQALSQAGEIVPAQSPHLVDWVVRPPDGEQVLVVASSEERTLDPHALRRKQDYQLVMAKFDQSPHIRVLSTQGNPPALYRLEYRVRGLTEEGGRITERDTHAVEISLLMDYPRIRPVCRMLTPAFHPNIDVDGTICIGDHWAAGELLTSIIIQIAQILTYQSYNIRSPRNAQAARWASENSNDLPLQRTDFWE